MAVIFWDRVNFFVKKQKTTQEYLAKKAGIKYQTLRNWVSRGIYPQAPEAERIARILGTSVEFLVTGKDRSAPEFKEDELKIIDIIRGISQEGKKAAVAALDGIYKVYKKEEKSEKVEKDESCEIFEIPYKGEVAAGEMIDMNEEFDLSLPVPARLITGNIENYFYVKVRGTSMSGAGIENGKYVLIHHEEIPLDGQIMMIVHNGESTLKRLKFVNNFWQLCWEDGSGKKIIVDSDGFSAQGKFIYST